MKRRHFLKQAGLVSTWLGVSVILHGCGGDDNPAAPAANQEPGSVTGAIGNNHGHSVAITGAQILAGSAVQLILGGGGHSHSVSLNAQQVSDIGAGMQVQSSSTSTSGHVHPVTFN